MQSNIDIKNFASAIAQIAEEKGISPEKILETIEMAIAAAYKKEYGKRGQIIKAKLDPGTGELKLWQVKQVLDKSMVYTEEELEKLKEKGKEIQEDEEGKKLRFNPEKHIMAEEARKIKPKIKPGEELETALEPKGDYGRIAAQTAKQVITQRIRESERESIFDEYKGKEGEIISGIVQRIEGGNVFMDIGKTLGILPREEQVPGEFYRPSQRLKTLVLKVEQTPKGPLIFLSRSYPKLVSKLFELEVPELSAGQIQIKSIAREAGSRTKIAVASTVEGIDPIGAAVGQRGTRVTAVINELGGEKIDIIEYSEDPEKYIANALSPAKVNEVKRLPKNKAQVIVPEDQLSLAIGKNGQNVRLAAKLTGWKIDVRGPAEAAQAPEEKSEEEVKKPKK
ncbi:MAG: transcription termination/antitermination protein NusA [Candidatus Nealsonbacteria bacterium CG23_combo_of_CG06-09_8_20_14_all_39_25]|uniref:Transcription termination/antitermination protein NusA n=4 Tax=Bacteria candidate phyla TaxID=1783234 RepID=A0A2G9YS71_9BACT|nr:MAG: transcription termination/antitermination protein NusA [Candidatus Nealsonbacteria bacterium CG23_combo_of_CG06-09_8_20_14_all_39_25]PIQ98657.1 MAG: transcription termination/antitermination protein NusA [Candidatus Nealsonbacteria bacterium CG11_big_fil_rev_8_21_14_0_20_39_9]PIZ88236.1 MAG: transcription termination/antitermination protein NusA [Candidatus Nealsonbacteria bacterium CG_4_10_14_0_2_um_filter_39_15]PJC68301.1 MAG: transcription termination/antitermination protein NusA [can